MQNKVRKQLKLKSNRKIGKMNFNNDKKVTIRDDKSRRGKNFKV